MGRPRRKSSRQILAQDASQHEASAGVLARLVESIPSELMQMIFCFVDSETLLVAVPAVCKLWRYHCAHTRVSVWVGFDERWGLRGLQLDMGVSHGSLLTLI